MIEWKEQRFSDINTKEFYEIFKFRSEVFVVEQEILYNDFDYKDYKAIHLSGFINNKLMAYARIFDKGDYYENNPGFGRVAVEKIKILVAILEQPVFIQGQGLH